MENYTKYLSDIFMFMLSKYMKSEYGGSFSLNRILLPSCRTITLSLTHSLTHSLIHSLCISLSLSHTHTPRTYIRTPTRMHTRPPPPHVHTHTHACTQMQITLVSSPFVLCLSAIRHLINLHIWINTVLLTVLTSTHWLGARTLSWASWTHELTP